MREQESTLEWSILQPDSQVLDKPENELAQGQTLQLICVVLYFGVRPGVNPSVEYSTWVD
jgi:hypothetical protein